MSPNSMDLVDRRTLLKLTGGAGVGARSGCLSARPTTAKTDPTGATGATGVTGAMARTEPTATTGATTEETRPTPTRSGWSTRRPGRCRRSASGTSAASTSPYSARQRIGIDGRDLEIIVEDSESENQGGIAAAQKLVNQDGVPFLIGAVGSGVSLAIYESVVEGRTSSS